MVRLDQTAQTIITYLMTCIYLVEQQVQRAIAHELCDYAEELGLIADAKDLNDVVEPGLVEHLCLLEQAVPFSETQPRHGVSFYNSRNTKTVTTQSCLSTLSFRSLPLQLNIVPYEFQRDSSHHRKKTPQKTHSVLD